MTRPEKLFEATSLDSHGEMVHLFVLVWFLLRCGTELENRTMRYRLRLSITWPLHPDEVLRSRCVKPCKCCHDLVSHDYSQRIIQSVSPSHGRALIYVWAVEQDDLSKRDIPSEEIDQSEHPGRDVFVPWVLTSQAPKQKTKPRSKRPKQSTAGDVELPKEVEDVPEEAQPKIFNRYYHMFAQGELSTLVREAAQEMGLEVASELASSNSSKRRRGVHIVEDGWERSNYYVELRRWECT